MKNPFTLVALLISLTFCSRAQSTIAYFNGPSFAIPAYYDSAALDLNQDGIADFVFAGGPFLCTDDIPISGCTAYYGIAAANTNGVLCQGYNVASILHPGALIGATASSNATWQVPDGATVITYFFSPRFGTSGWGGPLSSTNDGYLGVRFYAVDGLHYGWVHVVKPTALQNSPQVLEWAYETRPDTAIPAGALPLAPSSTPEIVRPQNLRLNWQSQIGQPYQVQFTEQLDLPGWTNLDFTVIATATNSSVDLPLTASLRFYRIVQTQ